MYHSDAALGFSPLLWRRPRSLEKFSCLSGRDRLFASYAAGDLVRSPALYRMAFVEKV